MFYDIGRIPASTPEKPQAFRMNSGGAYAKHPSGAFVRLDKFRGSKKARLAARRKGPGQ